jgi:sortase A
MVATPVRPDHPGAPAASSATAGSSGGEGTGEGAPASHHAGGAGRPPSPITPRRIVVALVVWLVVTAATSVLVLYGVGPMLEVRSQRSLLADYRVEIDQAANSFNSTVESEDTIEAPELGTPVAILDVGDMEMEQVVVEGVGPQQTRRGPGHVPGTAGPGQPGNSAIVARNGAFGGVFRKLDDLRRGDRILVTTTQGRSVYEVSEVRSASVSDTPEAAGEETTTTESTTTAATTTSTSAPEARGAAAGTTTTATTEPLLPEGSLTTADLYGPTPDDRLTLVTSASWMPWSARRAMVVVALMDGRPFEPTPQGGRTDTQDGRGSDSSALAPLILAAAAYVVAALIAVVLYRRSRPRSAYLLTAPPLVAATVLLAETAARLLPAWA